MAWSLKFGFPHQDLLMEEKKIKQRKSRMKKQGIGFKVKLQSGITSKWLHRMGGREREREKERPRVTEWGRERERE